MNAYTNLIIRGYTGLYKYKLLVKNQLTESAYCSIFALWERYHKAVLEVLILCVKYIRKDKKHLRRSLG